MEEGFRVRKRELRVERKGRRRRRRTTAAWCYGDDDGGTVQRRKTPMIFAEIRTSFRCFQPCS
ncbi:hypothetical protein NE237_000076 [Protea cynaroides]|uniref:Uncharacterized protein n=1 Tax=Protea cynaroides TaxID=273540 RepID=A0A9Q0JQU0_9MAGN|nr:hypothetical protein NE237_000076 [Protea cynaroides]